MNWFFKILRFLKGAAYYRFAIFVCLLGASFLAPQLWEGVLWIVTRIFDVIYQGGNVDKYEFQNFSPEPIDYVIGVFLIGIGIYLFTYYHKKFQKRENENDDYLSLSNLWVRLRDIYDENPNNDDLNIAINTMNITSTVLLNTSTKTISDFRNDRLDNFNTLYKRLTTNNYIIDGKNSKDLLNKKVKPAKILLNGKI